MASQIILGIESSCDETSAAVVAVEGAGLRVLACTTAGQDDLHEEYRGVCRRLQAVHTWTEFFL